MGGPMARNLLKAGHKVKAYDLSAELVQKVVDAGGIRAETDQDAASDVDVVVTMLPAGKHVAAVYNVEKGHLPDAKAGQLFLVIRSEERRGGKEGDGRCMSG